jgi:AraC family transcriptional regulator
MSASGAGDGPAVARVQVRREGHIVPLLHAHPPELSSACIGWRGLAFEDYRVPACVIPRHQHIDNFVHVILRGSVKYQVATRGRTLDFVAGPGTTFILPSGTEDELRWSGATHRIAVAMHGSLLARALDETAHEPDIELTEHWNLIDPQIMALLLSMKADLEAGSPAGKLYGECLCNALAVYLLKRFAARPITPRVYRGGLPQNRLKRVVDYIGAHIAGDLRLDELAAIAGMSPHYFAELFRKSTGRAPHRYILLLRVELAKQQLRNSRRSVIDVGLDVGFQNPSHFARIFRRFVGISPSRFQTQMRSR